MARRESSNAYELRNSGQKLTAFVVKENAGELLAMNELIAAGRVKPVLGASFPLAAGADAVAAFEAERADGRITITP
jgi:NADPH:quinone reductase-like Zn-dependent oxidoreductase